MLINKYIYIYIQYKLGKNNTREVYYSEFHVYYLPKRKNKKQIYKFT